MNTPPETPDISRIRAGIVDLKKKVEALKELFGVSTHKELAAAIMEEKNRTDQIVNGVIEGLRKNWLAHDPDGSIGTIFVRDLETRLKKLGCLEDEIKGTFCKGSFGEFERVLQDLTPPERTADADHRKWFEIVVLNAKTVTASQAVASGRLDQKQYYLSPDSASSWDCVVNANQYKQYDECVSALRVLLGSENFRKAISVGDIEGAITLGAGAPSKDLLVIGSLVKNLSGNAVHYTLVDYSPYMLQSTVRHLNNWLFGREFAKVNMTAVQGDFLDLHEARSLIRRRGRNVVWLILGGTIGNIDERDFFQSIRRSAMVGDLLVVGAETFSAQEDPEMLKDRLMKKYDSIEVRRFIEPILPSIWKQIEFKGDLESASERIQVRVVQGANHHSAVADAATVELFFPVNDFRRIVLLTSTRYVEANLIEFAAQSGFRYECSYPSPDNQWYKQFFFRRVD